MSLPLGRLPSRQTVRGRLLTATDPLSPQQHFRFVFPEDQHHLDVKPKWIIQDLIRENAVMTVCGMPGSFKSFLMLDAVMAISNGLDTFLGQSVKHGPVLYFCSDDGKHSVVNRLRMIAQFRLGTAMYNNIVLVDRGELNLSQFGADLG